MLGTYKEKTFKNVTDDALDLSDEAEKAAVEEENKQAEAMLAVMKDALGDKVSAVRFTATLKNRPACLSSEGEVSAEMEKVLNKMPGAQGDAVKAKMVLGINREHPVAEVLKGLVGRDDEKLRSYAKLLYAQARLIGGMSVEDPGETCELITALMV
jgi:molecular chaperone HtpG